ncbi:MAG: hypothetical protein J7647_31890 [Cyanobacteria bacterium SBLK]|nr:hypothetical protein [Cyanobacteria bacterium SBLK]
MFFSPSNAIANNLPENSCNSNTRRYGLNGFYDGNSSFLGDGFASAFVGEVSSEGTRELYDRIFSVSLLGNFAIAETI